MAGGIHMKLTEKEIEIIELLEKNARLSIDTIAKMVSLSVPEVEYMIKKLEEAEVIVQYATVVDWRKVDGHEGVTAMIDVKVTPKRGVGFDEVAERIYRFPEVKSVYLINGFSKGFAMTGWRLGFLAEPKTLAPAILKIHQYTMMCAPTMAQYAAIEALKNGAADVEQMKKAIDNDATFLFNR